MSLMGLERRLLAVLLLCTLLFTFHVLPVRAQVLGPACGGPPTIDGVFTAGEWDQASVYSFWFITDIGHWSQIYVMNDHNNLYICVRIQDNETYTGDYLRVYFDNDNDGVTEAGDDHLLISNTGVFSDMYITSGLSLQLDTLDTGINDGTGARGQDGGLIWTYEFSHPLCSGDNVPQPHDFCLTYGDIVGFTLLWTDDNGPGTDYGDFWPASTAFPGEWGDIEIGCSTPSPPEPVGGDIFTVDKLAILAPYLIIAIVVLTATSILVKKRKH